MRAAATLRSKCLFKCINCRRDCVTTSELSDTQKENIRTCCPRFQSVRARRSGFESPSCRLSVTESSFGAAVVQDGGGCCQYCYHDVPARAGKKRISNAPGSVAYFDLSFAHGRAVGNTKAWPPGNYRPEVDACLDSALGQKPTIRSHACGRKKRTACYFLTYPRMTLTPSLPGAQAQRTGVCPHWRHICCLSSERANFTRLVSSWRVPGSDLADDGARGGPRHERTGVYSLVRLLIRAASEQEHD